MGFRKLACAIAIVNSRRSPLRLFLRRIHREREFVVLGFGSISARATSVGRLRDRFGCYSPRLRGDGAPA